MNYFTNLEQLARGMSVASTEEASPPVVAGLLQDDVGALQSVHVPGPQLVLYKSLEFLRQIPIRMQRPSNIASLPASYTLPSPLRLCWTTRHS